MSWIKQENLKLIGQILFGVDSMIQLGSSHQLKIIANNDAGSLLLSGGTGGITLDSTKGSGNSGSQLGALSLISKSSSSWLNSSSNLSLQTLNSGNINLTSINAINIVSNTESSWTSNNSNLLLQTLISGNVNITSIDAFNFSAVKDSSISVSAGELILNSNIDIEILAPTVNIGSSNGIVNILGNLHVVGSSTILSSTNLNVGTNSIIVNALPSGSNVDSSILVKRSGSDITTYDSAPIASYTTGASSGNTGIGSHNTLTLNSSDTFSGVNSWIKLTSGPLINQIAQILTKTDNIVTINTLSSPISLTGSAFNVTSDGTVLTGTETLFTTQLMVGQTITISNSIAQTYIISNIISDTSVTLSNNSNIISGVSAQLIIDGWDPSILLTSGTYIVSGTSGYMIITGSNSFTSNLTAGASIQVTIGGSLEIYYVTGITSGTIATLSNHNLTIGTSTTTAVICSPGSTIGYSVYNDIYAGIVFKATTKQFVFESTLNTSNTIITPISLLDIKAAIGTFNSIVIANTGISTSTGAWSSGNYSVGTLSGSMLSLSGGLSSTSNMIIESSTINSSLVDVRQCNSNANPVISLLQSHSSAPILSISSKSTPIGSGLFSTYNDITKTLVSSIGNGNINAAEIMGYFMINVTDNSNGTNPIASGIYHVPFYSLNA